MKHYLYMSILSLFLAGCRSYHMMPTFISEVKSNVDPYELQRWACNLIAEIPIDYDEMPVIREKVVPERIKSLQKYRGSFFDVSYQGCPTNKLKGISVSSECIRGEYELCVTLKWRSKKGRHWGLMISHPSFRPIVCDECYLSEWVPGVYFYEMPPAEQ